MQLYIFLYLCSFFSFTQGLQKIWFLRHCDKPHNKDNPCCSHTGYKRAELWPIYFATRLPPDSRIAIYTSGYDKGQTQCISGSDTSNKHCPSSQRMWITASTLYNHLHSPFPFYKHLYHHFCIGDTKRLQQEIIQNAYLYTDVIIIWEHKEIQSMIRDWTGEDVSVHHYNRVFVVDITKTSSDHPTLHIDCFPLANETCPSISLTTMTPHRIFTRIVVILFSLFSFFCIGLSLYVCCKDIRSDYRRIPDI